MKSIATLCPAIATAFSVFGIAHAAPPESFAPGRILFEPRAGLVAGELSKLLKLNGGNQTRKLGQSNIHVLEVPKGLEKAIVNKLRNNPHFKYAELDQMVPVAATANDPYLGSE